jgi:cytochrome P450
MQSVTSGVSTVQASAQPSVPWRRTLEDLPSPRGWPLIGNLLQVDVVRAHQTFARWADQLGHLYHVRLGRRQILVIAEPGLVNEILHDRPGRFQRPRIMRDAMIDLAIAGVFTAEGADWRRQRKLAMHALNTDHLRKFAARLCEVTERLQRRWQRAADRDERVDAPGDLKRFTVDVTSSLAFGTDLNTLECEGDAIQRHLGVVFPALARRVFAPFAYWRWIRLPSDRAVDRAMREVLVLVHELVRNARAHAAESVGPGARPANFLEAMARAQSDDTAFSDREIVGNVLTLLLAGEDTTANTIAWIMHLMAEHPEVQARLQAEVDAVPGEASTSLDYETTEALPYVEAVAHEAMRLRPVAPLQAMEAKADTVLGDVQVPKGTELYLLSGYMASRPEHFAEPEAFRPERWLENQHHARPGHNTHAFVPFGGGPRFCPGRHLAMLEIKMVVAMLCRHFEVCLLPDTPPPEEVFSFTMMPNELFVRLRPRARAAH